MERIDLLDLPENDLKLKYIKEETETGTRTYFAITKYPESNIWWNISTGWQIMKNTEGRYESGVINRGTKVAAILWLRTQFMQHPSYMASKLGQYETELRDLLDKHYSMMCDFSNREISQLTMAQMVSGGTPATGTPATGTPTTATSLNLDLTATNELLKTILEKQMKVDEFKENTITAIAEKILNAKTEQVTQGIIDRADKAIKQKYGELPEVKTFILPDKKEVTKTGTFHRELENIMRLIQLDIPIMLTGPAGSGKNYTLEKATEILGLDFYFTNAVTEEFKLTGFIDANGNYHETEFFKAFKNGGVFFLDEIDASIPEALIILNAAIANRYYDFPIGRIKAHEDFRVVAAANTYGTGADMVYVGRNVLDGATLDRFTVIPFNYDERVEQSLCPNRELYEFCTELRNAINKKHLRYIISPRAMMTSYKMINDLDNDKPRFTKEYITKVAIIKGMQKDDLVNIKSDISDNNPWKKALNNIIDEL